MALPELLIRSALVEVVPPPPSLVIFGTGADAQALVTFAEALGWDVTVTGSHPARARSGSHMPTASS